jgi:hypothetical protein
MNDQYKMRLKMLSDQMLGLMGQINSVASEITAGGIVLPDQRMIDAEVSLIAIVAFIKEAYHDTNLVKMRDLV